MSTVDVLTLKRLGELLGYQQNGSLVWLKPRGRMPAGATAGSPDKDGYLCIRVDSKLYKAHHLVWYMHTGELPERLDHINGVRWDNRICNLRQATAQENGYNRGAQSNNSSGHKGVSKAMSGRYRARIKLGGREYNLGVFDTPEEASLAYKRAAKTTHGDFYHEPTSS